MYKIGKKVNGVITGVKDYGVFVKLSKRESGLVHISEFSDGFVKNINDYVKLGEQIDVEVLEFDASSNKYKLSIKRVGKPKKSKRETIRLTIGFDTLEKKIDGWVAERMKYFNENKY